MRMIIAGGGSGGHLFPGIAVADELRSREEDSTILFIGTEQGLEASIIPKEGYSIKFVRAEGFLGKSLPRKAASLLRLIGSVFAARKIIRESGADIVIGTGGYVSVGPVLAARTLGVSTVIMEQNLVPGLANRMLGRFADAVAVTYHESMAYFPRAKVYLTGNPVRTGMLEGDPEAARKLLSLEADRITVLVLGGSAGARSINNSILNALNYMLDIRDSLQFVHQTGQSDYEAVRQVYRKLGYRAMVVPFIHEMTEAYASADMVVTRAGATTLAEITSIGIPAILVPYAHAGGHQEFNARKLLEIGAAKVIRENELSGQLLAEEIKDLYASGEKRAEMKKQSRVLGRPDAAKKAVDIALSMARAGRDNV